MYLVMIAEGLDQFILKASARSSIGSSLPLLFRSRLNSSFCVSCFYFTVLEHCRISGILCLGYSSLMIHDFSISCTADPMQVLILGHNFLTAPFSKIDTMHYETAGVCKGTEFSFQYLGFF